MFWEILWSNMINLGTRQTFGNSLAVKSRFSLFPTLVVLIFKYVVFIFKYKFILRQQ